MNPHPHSACNDTLLKPAGMTEEQCRDLPIYREIDGGIPFVSSFWIPEPGELEHLNQGGSIWFRMMGSTHPPMNLLVSPPAPVESTDATPREPLFIITNEHWNNLTAENSRLLAWQKKEFDDSGDALFNVRRLRARIRELEQKARIWINPDGSFTEMETEQEVWQLRTETAKSIAASQQLKSSIEAELQDFKDNPREPLTDAEALRLLQLVKRHSDVAAMDNRELLWRLLNTAEWQNIVNDGEFEILSTELENRLYPDYDGETITWEKWGWRTATEDIVYDASQVPSKQ